MVNMKIVTFPVTAFTTNSNISSGIPSLFPLLMSGHILSWEGKHILACSVDRPLNRDQDFMHKEESSTGWASREPAGIILSSETWIPSKHCRQISPSASAVGWIICMINCRWPSVAFICTILGSVMSTIWHVWKILSASFSPAFFRKLVQALSTIDYAYASFITFF